MYSFSLEEGSKEVDRPIQSVDTSVSYLTIGDRCRRTTNRKRDNKSLLSLEKITEP